MFIFPFLGYVDTDAFRNEAGFGAMLSKIGLFFTGITPEKVLWI